MIDIPCARCGNITRKSAAISRRNARFFCSSACYHVHRSTGHIDRRGYRVVTSGGKQVGEHRLIVEDLLKRKLTRSEHVHHINGDTLDNSPSNLQVLSHSEHSIEHHPLGWDLERAKAMLAEGRTLTDIGKEMGVTYQAICLVLTRRGLYKPRTIKKRLA